MTKRGRLWLTRGVTIGVVTLIGLVLIATWLQAGTVGDDWLAISAETEVAEATVVGVQPGVVTLAATAGADLAGIWGVTFDGGRAVLGDVREVSPDEVKRDLLEVTGALTPGTRLVFDASVWSEAAAVDRFGFSDDVAIAADGVLPIWTAPGTDDTWVIFVHGNGADRTQALRLAPVVNGAGYPVVVASYRNDAGATAPSTGSHGFGYDEWRDVQAVVDFALRDGALDVVVVGYGSGGSIAGAFLYESRVAERVLGVVLDSPMLSLRTAIHDAWVADGVPGWTIGWTKAIASMRFGLDLGAIDHVTRAPEWTAPALVLFGRRDEVNPLDAVEAFAIARGDEALLLTFPDAGADALWNTDSARYESAVLGFIESVAGSRSEFEPIDPER